MSHDNDFQRARATYIPGGTATGLLINIDRSKNMFVLRLLCGARGWLSTFDVADEELDMYATGSPVTAIVDRVESDENGNINVVLKRESESDSLAFEDDNPAPRSVPVSVSPIGGQRENARLRLEDFADDIDALIAVDEDGSVKLFLDQVSGFWDFASHIKPVHRRIGVLRLQDAIDEGLSLLRVTETDLFETGLQQSVRGWFKLDSGSLRAFQTCDSNLKLGKHIDEFDAALLVDVTLIRTR